MLRSYGITAAAIASSTADLSSALWQTFIQHSREKVCWKDPSHRIRGASRAFCAWLGIPEQELLGKTIRELGFCVDCQVDEETDETAMRTGQAVPGSSFHFIVKQQPHLVQIDKFPLYQHDRMAGVVLCCHDVEDVTHPQIDALHAAITDEETGLLNYRGMVMAGLRYADTYRLYGDDYTAALIDVPEFDAIGLTYGQGFRRHLLQKITAILKEYLPPALTLAHIAAAVSCCSRNPPSSGAAASPCPDFQCHPCHPAGGWLPLHALHALRHCPGLRGPQPGQPAAALDQAHARVGGRAVWQALYTSDRFIFDREAFDHLEEGVVVIDPETYELLYCNPAMRRRIGLPLDAPLAGRKCYALLAGLAAPCNDCCQSQLSRGRFHSRMFHNPVAGVDFLLRDTLIPWHGKNCHFTTALNLDAYLTRDMRFNKMLFFDASVNDALRLGMYETDPVRGIQQMMSRIGRQLGADRIVLAEEKGDCVAITYTWEAEGILPLGEDFQPIPREMLRPVFDQFAKGNSFSIPDMTTYWQEHPELAPHIPGIRQVAMARLMLDGEPYGFIDAINPAPGKLHQAEELLAALTRFFTILLRNRGMMQRLDRLSKADQLTGS